MDQTKTTTIDGGGENKLASIHEGLVRIKDIIKNDRDTFPQFVLNDLKPAIAILESVQMSFEKLTGQQKTEFTTKLNAVLGEMKTEIESELPTPKEEMNKMTALKDWLQAATDKFQTL